VRALRKQPGKDIWLFGGGSLFNSLLGMGLVDEVQVAIVPVLLGGGRPLLEAPADRTPLQLRKHTLYPKTGTVLLDYDVVPR
jgi:dihydrofolate reductase